MFRGIRDGESPDWLLVQKMDGGEVLIQGMVYAQTGYWCRQGKRGD